MSLCSVLVMPYLARVAWMRFLRAVLSLERAIRVRWSSLSSRISLGGSHTMGRLSRWRSLARPLASSLSVLPKVPGTGVDVAHHDLGLGSVREKR
jgi:hypothetical protein